MEQMGERQYYYFYGSTSDSGPNANHSNGDRKRDRVNGSNGTSGPSVSSPSQASNGTATENDSLVGECLISTDNDEEETPKNSQADFQQLLVSRGNSNGQLHPLAPLPEEGKPWRIMFCPPSPRWHDCCSSQFRRFRQKHSVSHIILIFAGVSLALTLAFAVAAHLLLHSTPSSSLSTTNSSKSSLLLPNNPIVTAMQSVKKFQIPWPRIDRAAYNDPIGNFMDPTLFHSSLRCDDKCRSKSKDGSAEFIFPFPTGAFWTNLVLPPTADRGLSYPIAVYPYAYKWSDSLLQASYPAQHRKEEPKAIHDYFFPDLSFGIQEDTVSRYVVAFDPLSVTLRYSAEGRDSFWETYLVQGSPYITIKYNKASPVLTAFSTFTNIICPREDLDSTLNDGKRRRHLKFGVCSTKGDTSEQGNDQITTLLGVQFTVETQEGVRWIVFASELATLDLDMKTRTKIYVSAEDGKAPYTGVLRLAIIPPVSQPGCSTLQHSGSDSTIVQTESALDQILDSTGVRRLIYHAGVYPISGAVSWSFRTLTTDTSDTSDSPASAAKRARIATVTFKFEARSFTPTSSGPKNLLMLALPHHAQVLPLSTQLGTELFDLRYQCIKGRMRPVLGSVWSYDVALHSLDFDSALSSTVVPPLLSPGVKSKILDSLVEDIKLALPTPTENVYGFGKQVARLAQLAHIARHMANSDDDNIAMDVLQKATVLLTSSMQEFLEGKVSDSLVYDSNLGGMVTKDGLLNANADFGNGRYNDHHFHYGKLLRWCIAASFVVSNCLVCL
jgi:Glycosyl hydrolase family 81 N-terminal domain/Glycosyl hydrolase family 81 C-terminal domain